MDASINSQDYATVLVPAQLRSWYQYMVGSWRAQGRGSGLLYALGDLKLGDKIGSGIEGAISYINHPFQFSRFFQWSPLLFKTQLVTQSFGPLQSGCTRTSTKPDTILLQYGPCLFSAIFQAVPSLEILEFRSVHFKYVVIGWNFTYTTIAHLLTYN